MRILLFTFLLLWGSWATNAQDDVLFDEIRLTETIADYGLTGKGTIVAVLDRGIDYRHPDFINEDGTSRILAIFDLSDDQGALASNNPYGKGTIYTQEQINTALQTNLRLPTRDAVGHGHVTAGIAAGNGRGSNGRIVGIAPEAEIIVVKITGEGAPAIGTEPAEAPFNFIDDYLDDAIDFIISVAADEGKPVSMVANFGSIQGPMDGTSTLSRFLDSRFGADAPGRAFVSGSSDDGGVDNHAGGEFVQGQTISIQIEKTTSFLRLDLWHHEDDEVQIELVTPNETFGPYDSPANNTGLNDGSNDFRLFYLGSEQDFFGSTSPRKELLIDLLGTNGTYTLNITGTNIQNGRFDAVLNPSRIFSDNPSKFLTFVEPGYTIWDLGSSKNNICPNSYILRETWRSVDGNNYSFRGDENGVGSLWTGSGVGPTQDGRFGIDVSVPGNVNFGAYPEVSFFTSITPNVVEFNQGAPYGTLAAVSGANPVLAGVIALMLEADPSLTAPDIKRILQETARSDAFTGSVPNSEWGYGKLDVYAAIESILGPVNSTSALLLNRQVKVAPNPSRDLFQLSRADLQEVDFDLFLFDAQGKVLKSWNWQKGETNLEIDLKAFSPGIYYLQGKSSLGQFSKKLMKL